MQNVYLIWTANENTASTKMWRNENKAEKKIKSNWIKYKINKTHYTKKNY